MTEWVSRISLIRSAAVIASCAIARIPPSDVTGQISDSIRVMNATRVPSVIASRPTASAPSSSTITRVRFGITPRKLQNRDASRTLSTEVS